MPKVIDKSDEIFKEAEAYIRLSKKVGKLSKELESKKADIKIFLYSLLRELSESVDTFNNPIYLPPGDINVPYSRQQLIIGGITDHHSGNMVNLEEYVEEIVDNQPEYLKQVMNILKSTTKKFDVRLTGKYIEEIKKI